MIIGAIISILSGATPLMKYYQCENKGYIQGIYASPEVCGDYSLKIIFKCTEGKYVVHYLCMDEMKEIK